jgi:hypothetical protein
MNGVHCLQWDEWTAWQTQCPCAFVCLQGHSIEWLMYAWYCVTSSYSCSSTAITCNTVPIPVPRTCSRSGRICEQYIHITGPNPSENAAMNVAATASHIAAAHHEAAPATGALIHRPSMLELRPSPGTCQHLRSHTRTLGPKNREWTQGIFGAANWQRFLHRCAE